MSGSNGPARNGQHGDAGTRRPGQPDPSPKQPRAAAYEVPDGQAGGWRETLRGLPVFISTPPAFLPDEAPGHPLTLFAGWLRRAIETVWRSSTR